MDRKETKIIVIASIKGGVGKSTSAIILSDLLVNKGSSVLLIDIDTQASTTSYFFDTLEKKEIDITKINIYEVLKDNLDIRNSIVNIKENLFLLPSYLSLHQFSSEALPFKETRLKDNLNFIENVYDYIIIDTNPSLDFTLINALVVSNYILIPMLAEKWAVESLDLFQFFLKKLKLKTPIFLLNTRLKKNNSHKFLLDIIKENPNFLGSISEREDLNKRIAENSNFDFTKDYIKEYENVLKEFVRKTNINIKEV